MKTYKVKPAEGSVIMINKHKSVQEFYIDESQVEELIKQYNTKETNGRYFFPKDGENYWYLNDNGDIYRDIYEKNIRDDCRVKVGVFKELSDAEKARDRQQAIVAIDKWIQENGIDTDVDWDDHEKHKHCVYYNYDDKEWRTNVWTLLRENLTIPTFKSKEDCKKFIDACTNQLNLLL